MPPDPETPAGEAASRLVVRAATALKAVDPLAWDLCSHPAAIATDPACGSENDSEDPANPFLTHAFLSSLEESGSAAANTGWSPLHVLVEDAAGTLLAAAPCYLKGHSQGEYVFDHAWADAYERAGGDYYPKLQVCVPFTPATGRRLLVRPGPRAEQAREMLIQGLRALRAQVKASSVHVTFSTRDEWEALGAAGFLQRTDRQFHWLNEGYGTFDDFLAALASRKRKNIRREREAALSEGLTIEWLTGSDLTERVWDDFFRFYMDTGGRKWGRPYLSRSFYSLIGERMADRILLIMVRNGGRYVAGAINFIGRDTLYGRHWGCIEDHPFLHFETCYYQAIEYAIRHGLKRVEAGAQGEHKLARGYRPVTTYSAHDIADRGLKRAVADYLERERAYVSAESEELSEHMPFRKDLAITLEGGS